MSITATTRTTLHVPGLGGLTLSVGESLPCHLAQHVPEARRASFDADVELTTLDGLGEARAWDLVAAGVCTLDALAASDAEVLAAASGISASRITDWQSIIQTTD